MGILLKGEEATKYAQYFYIISSSTDSSNMFQALWQPYFG